MTSDDDLSLHSGWTKEGTVCRDSLLMTPPMIAPFLSFEEYRRGGFRSLFDHRFSRRDDDVRVQCLRDGIEEDNKIQAIEEPGVIQPKIEQRQPSLH